MYEVSVTENRMANRRKSYTFSTLFHLLLDVCGGFHTISSASAEQPEAQPLAR